MNFILTSIILSICSATQCVSPKEHVGNEKEYAYFNGVIDSSKYIKYDFGGSKIYSVYLANDNDRVVVFILDSKNNVVIEDCEMSPILKWAFEDAPNELIDAQFEIENNYTPIYHKLTLKVDSVPITLDSSAMRIKKRKGTAKKIYELKKFIMSLFAEWLIINNKD